MNEKPLAAYHEYGEQFASFYDDLFPRDAIGLEVLNWMAHWVNCVDPTVIEFGAGTGRVAVPLAQHLLDHVGLTTFQAVDISLPMLERLAQADTNQLITPVIADITEWRTTATADLLLMVCGTLGMITNPEQQRQVMSNAASSMNIGGALIVEVHHSAFVEAIHPNRSMTFASPMTEGKRALVSFSDLRATSWRIDHRWVSEHETLAVDEESRVTTVEEVAHWGLKAGLTLSGTFGSLIGGELTRNSPTATLVFRRLQP